MQLTTYNIRLAQESEADQLAAIEIEAAGRFACLAPPLEIFNQSFERKKLLDLIAMGQVWLVSTEDNLPVGFAIASVSGGMAYLEEMDVLPAHGKRGLGTRLLSTVCHWAKTKGLSAIFLSTFSEVAWNAPFYRRFGFRTIEEAQWTEAMHRIRKEEIASGLCPDKRVFMQFDLL